MGYTPRGRKESDTTERLSNSISIYRVDGLNVRKGPQALLEVWIRIRGWGDLPGGPVVRTLLLLPAAWVRSLVRKLRSRKPHGMEKKKKERIRE